MAGGRLRGRGVSLAGSYGSQPLRFGVFGRVQQPDHRTRQPPGPRRPVTGPLHEDLSPVDPRQMGQPVTFASCCPLEAVRFLHFPGDALAPPQTRSSARACFGAPRNGPMRTRYRRSIPTAPSSAAARRTSISGTLTPAIASAIATTRRPSRTYPPRAGEEPVNTTEAVGTALPAVNSAHNTSAAPRVIKPPTRPR